MGLDITLLKVEHMGIHEAQKALPYLNKCDVYGSESPLSEDEVAQNEAAWAGMLRQNLSPEQRERFLDLSFADSRSLPSLIEYSKAVQRRLLELKIPQWHVERYSAQEAQAIREGFSHAQAVFERGVNTLIRGDVEEALADIHARYVAFFKEFIPRRDRNMAKNLAKAERAIRKQYKKLSKKRLIRYVVAIGAEHSPETYGDFKARIIDLTDYEPVDSAAIAAVRAGTPQERMRQELLVAGLSIVTKKDWPVEVPPEQLKQMSIDELLDVLTEVKKHADKII